MGLAAIKLHPQYRDQYVPSGKPDITHLVFDIPAEAKQTIVAPFLLGKYSLIDRKYAEEKFNKLNDKGETVGNYLILTKDPRVLDYWLHVRDLYIPEDQEVWSKPEKEFEIYNYPTVTFSFDEQKFQSCTSEFK